MKYSTKIKKLNIREDCLKGKIDGRGASLMEEFKITSPFSLENRVEYGVLL